MSKGAYANRFRYLYVFTISIVTITLLPTKDYRKSFKLINPHIGRIPSPLVISSKSEIRDT